MDDICLCRETSLTDCIDSRYELILILVGLVDKFDNEQFQNARQPPDISASLEAVLHVRCFVRNERASEISAFLHVLLPSCSKWRFRKEKHDGGSVNLE